MWVKGVPRSEETKAKISLATKGRSFSLEHRQKISQGLRGNRNGAGSKGHIVTEATKAKIRARALGRVPSLETRKKLSHPAYNKGVPCPEEMKRRISEKLTGRRGVPWNDHQRAVMSVLLTGRKISDETKRRISAANRGRKLTPEHRAKMSEVRKGKPQSKEHKRKNSEANRKRLEDPEQLSRLLDNIFKLYQRDTSLELILWDHLERQGIPFVRKKRIGRYQVDAWLPELNFAVEADGAYWHQDKDRDAKRDQYLLTKHGLSAVFRFSEQELKELNASFSLI